MTRFARIVVGLLAWATLGVAPAHAAAAPVLLVLGDSISAGYGLAAGEGEVAAQAQRQ